MKTKTTKEHFDKYSNLVKSLGLEVYNNSFLGRDKEAMLKCFEQDRHLNNIPLRAWDLMAGLLLRENIQSRALSLAERVCCYKHLVIHNWLGIEPDYIE